jgi:hypothetical protein
MLPEERDIVSQTSKEETRKEIWQLTDSSPRKLQACHLDNQSRDIYSSNAECEKKLFVNWNSCV